MNEELSFWQKLKAVHYEVWWLFFVILTFVGGFMLSIGRQLGP